MEKTGKLRKEYCLIVIIRTMKQLIFIQDIKGTFSCLPRWDSGVSAHRLHGQGFFRMVMNVNRMKKVLNFMMTCSMNF